MTYFAPGAQSRHHASRLWKGLSGLLCLVAAPLLWAADSNVVTGDGDLRWVWNLLIAFIVFVVSAASAALPVAACRKWRRYWRIGAALPLVCLGIWLVVILLSKLLAPDSHRLWPFEVFAWAMLNMIYMAGLMTARRLFEKADKQEV